jgi:hypothetical protein
MKQQDVCYLALLAFFLLMAKGAFKNLFGARLSGENGRIWVCMGQWRAYE